MKLGLVPLAVLVAFVALLHTRLQETHPDHVFQFQILAALSVAGYFLAMRLIPTIPFNSIFGDLRPPGFYLLFFGDADSETPSWQRWQNILRISSLSPIALTIWPESLGIVPATVWLMVVILFQPIFHDMLGQYNAALISVCWMVLLGFTDDVLDLRWAFKILLSLIATMPLLVSYDGPTNIIVPKPLRDYIGLSVDLSVLYLVYMMLTVVFCTNSINIYAGINGLEVSQSVVIAGAVLVHNWVELGGGCEREHLMSVFLIVPFLAVSLALLYYNWYPSQVFVGDTYTYFAGMTLAVAGIEGHFSKTLMLFFLPELINFVLSLPQLFGLIPCPRHRLPKFDPKSGLLNFSYADPEKKYRNLTLINAFIWVLGPMHERTLCIILILFQILCCGLGFAVRYSTTVTNMFYDPVNLTTC